MLGIDIVLMALSALLLSCSLLARIASGKRLGLALNLAILSSISVVLALETQMPVHSLHSLLSFNPYSLFFMLLFTLGMLLVNILAYQYSENYGDFAVLSNFALLGMYLVAGSTTLLTIFIGLELATIPAIFMILLSKRSIEAATKFFIMASVAVALFSFSMVLFYGGTGNLALGQSAKSDLLAFSAILFIVSLGIDSSVFPFNLLIPDVYQGSPAYVTSMLGGLNKKVAFAALIQILILSFVAYRSAFEAIAVLSVLTMFYGNIVAMMQDNLKRMLAYSSISQAGYILIGIATASALGIEASLFQIFSHAFAFIGILGVAAWLESRNKNTISDLNGLNSENRFMAFSLTVFMLAFLGMPLTTGFIGKLLLFLGAANSGLLWLALAGIVNSIISMYYYARPIMAAYASKPGARRLPASRAVIITVAISLVITVAIGIYPQPVIGFASGAAHYLLAA